MKHIMTSTKCTHYKDIDSQNLIKKEKDGQKAAHQAKPKANDLIDNFNKMYKKGLERWLNGSECIYSSTGLTVNIITHVIQRIKQ